MTTEVRNILLAEDNENDVELTLAALREHRLTNEIAVARDGADALDYLYRRNRYASRMDADPGLILLDLKMPRVDGIEVLRQIKSDPRLKMIPTVVLTSSREESDLVASYALGVNAYVVKPVGFPEFVKAIREIGVFWALINEPPPDAERSGSEMREGPG